MTTRLSPSLYQIDPFRPPCCISVALASRTGFCSVPPSIRPVRSSQRFPGPLKGWAPRFRIFSSPGAGSTSRGTVPAKPPVATGSHQRPRWERRSAVERSALRPGGRRSVYAISDQSGRSGRASYHSGRMRYANGDGPNGHLRASASTVRVVDVARSEARRPPVCFG